MQGSAPKLIAAADLPDYPISAEDRLDSHYFMQWNLKRWRSSDFRKKADPEVGWFGFQLFCIAQDNSPIGTLPVEDELLAFDLNLPLEKWRGLMQRAITPLHGWYRVRCDNGEIRLAHKVVTEVAEKALSSNRTNAATQEKRRERKRLADLKVRVEAIGAKHLLNHPGYLERLDACLLEHFPNRNRTEAVVREALDILGTEGG